MIDYILNVQLHPKQQEIHSYSARFKVVKAGKRFGKSHWACFELVQMAARVENGVFWYIAPTYGQAKEIAWEFLKGVIPQNLMKSAPLNTDLEISLVSGSKIKLKGADNEQSLRGPSLDGVIFDEAAYIDGYLWPAIIRGQLAKSCGPAYFISSPSKQGRNWYSSFCEEAKNKMLSGNKDWGYWHYTIYDNPFITREEIADIKSQVPDDKWELEYMAEESEYSGVIYSEFNDSHIGVMEPQDDWFLFRGIDWGIAHPTVCLWIWLDVKNKTIYVSDEFFKSGYLIQESASAIKQISGKKPVEWTVIDPSCSKRNSQTGRSDMLEFARYGVSCIPADNRDRGYDVLKMFFKYGRIKIHPKCKNLIAQLRTLQRGDKDGDDAPDVLRYIALRIHDYIYGMNILEKKEEKPKDPRVMNIYDIGKRYPKSNDMSWACPDMEEKEEEYAGNF